MKTTARVPVPVPGLCEDRVLDALAPNTVEITKNGSLYIIYVHIYVYIYVYIYIYIYIYSYINMYMYVHI